jgi:hypothetical protein
MSPQPEGSPECMSLTFNPPAARSMTPANHRSVPPPQPPDPPDPPSRGDDPSPVGGKLMQPVPPVPVPSGLTAGFAGAGPGVFTKTGPAPMSTAPLKATAIAPNSEARRIIRCPIRMVVLHAGVVESAHQVNLSTTPRVRRFWTIRTDSLNCQESVEVFHQNHAPFRGFATHQPSVHLPRPPQIWHRESPCGTADPHPHDREFACNPHGEEVG